MRFFNFIKLMLKWLQIICGYLRIFAVCLKNKLYICNMKQPNIIDHGHKAVSRFTNFLIWLCIMLSISLFICVVVLFTQREQLKLLKDKVQRDTEAVKSYKDLLLTQ